MAGWRGRVGRCLLRRGEDGRNNQGKGAAFTGRAVQGQLAAQQMRQIARDRQPQPCAAVLAVGTAVGLAEGIKDQSLLVRRDANAGVADGKRHHAAGRRAHPQRDISLAGEFDGVGEQIFQHLA